MSINTLNRHSQIERDGVSRLPGASDTYVAFMQMLFDRQLLTINGQAALLTPAWYAQMQAKLGWLLHLQAQRNGTIPGITRFLFEYHLLSSNRESARTLNIKMHHNISIARTINILSERGKQTG